MIIDSAPTEYVYHLSDAEQLSLLKKQLKCIYQRMVDHCYIPEASYERIGNVERYFSGLPGINFNAIVGCLEDPLEYDARIEEELSFFGSVPFFWYVEENAQPSFKEALKKHGFIDVGIFRGVMGALEAPIAASPISEDCVLELVEDEDAMGEFTDLLCGVFSIENPAKDAYRKMLWNLTQEKENREWYHWVARKQDKVVSVVSTMIKDGIVSFWNGATSLEVRKQGLSTALRRFSLQHAIANGAHYGSSYLMAEGLAFGICTKLGYETKWRFHAFAPPSVCIH